MTGPDSEGLQAGYLDSEFAAEALATIVLYGMDNDRPPAEVAANVLAHLKMHLPSSPVVPSVAAVPVEVPEEAAIVDAMVDAIYAAYADPESYGHTRPLYQRDMGIGLRAAYPLIAARVRAEAVSAERQRIKSRLVQAYIANPEIGRDYGVNAGLTLASAAVGDPDVTAIAAAGSAVPVATPQRPEIVVLCGSTRFKDAFREAAKSEALAGRIVLTVSDLDPRPEMRHVNVPIDAETKARLDQLHRHKIDLAGRVLVLNVGGYIGESTRAEIDYAAAHGKPITYLESPAPTTTCPHGLTMPHEDSSFVTGVTSTCPGPVATPTEPAQDYRLCSGGFRAADGQAVPCEHDEIGPHRPPNEQDGQR